MLRRYLIVNGVSTALMYAVYWTFVPSMPSIIEGVKQAVNLQVVQNSLLAPIFYRVITVIGG